MEMGFSARTLTKCTERGICHGNAACHIDVAVVERIESFKFLSVHITKDLSW